MEKQKMMACDKTTRYTIEVKQSTKNSLVNLMAVRWSQEKWKSNMNQITKSCTDKKEKENKKLWNTNFECMWFNADSCYTSNRCDSKDKNEYNEQQQQPPKKQDNKIQTK